MIEQVLELREQELTEVASKATFNGRIVTPSTSCRICWANSRLRPEAHRQYWVLSLTLRYQRVAVLVDELQNQEVVVKKYRRPVGACVVGYRRRPTGAGDGGVVLILTRLLCEPCAGGECRCAGSGDALDAG